MTDLIWKKAKSKQNQLRTYNPNQVKMHGCAHVTLVAVNTLGFFALIASLISLHPKIRNRCNKIGENDGKAGEADTKVMPINGNSDNDDDTFRSWGQKQNSDSVKF